MSSVASEGNANFMRYDTARQGNSNRGHAGPASGTDMPESDETALLEYLETL